MKLKFSKSLLIKIVRFLKWGKILAKFAAIGTTVSGAITALSGSATSGVALSAAGATTYAATKGLPSQGYEKTKHIPPGRVDKAANMLRQQEIARAKGHMKKTPAGMLPGIVMPTKSPGRSAAAMQTSTMMTPRKK